MNNDKKYSVIYADPPWRYRDATPNRKVENHYPTMALEDIKNIPVPSEKNSVLFLWATTGKLPECLEVMKAWGYEYKSSLVWDKLVYGMGYWFRGQHEFLLVGTKGKFSPPAQPLRIRSVYQEKRTKHSKKPDHIRNLITSWYPEYSKLEMFARQKTNGWDVWGNEVENDYEIRAKTTA
jgi:N6-adenosine-specific RNA methylase IME4